LMVLAALALFPFVGLFRKKRSRLLEMAEDSRSENGESENGKSENVEAVKADE
jgi:hypothetical protein